MNDRLFDLRHAVRSLRRAPGLGVLAGLTLTLGIGLPTTMFAVITGVFATPPFEDSDRIVRMFGIDLEAGRRQMVGAHDYADWRAAQTSFDDIAGFRSDDVTLSGGEARPLRHDAVYVTPNLFGLLGVDPVVGRGFLEADAGPAASDVAILSHGLWQDRFAGDPDVVGRTLRIDGAPHTVVGVMRERFGFPAAEELWLPLGIPLDAARGEGDGVQVVGRLRDGVTIERARAEMEGIARRLALAYPATNAKQGAGVLPFDEGLIDEELAGGLYTMFAAVSFVLLIACVNVANLLLARAIGRRREVAVRSALGAPRRRLVSQFLAESLVVAGIGGALGTVVAWLGVAVLGRTIFSSVGIAWADFRVDGTVLLFVLGVVVLGALLAGVLPAWQASSIGPGDALKDSPRGLSGPGLRIGRLGRSLVAVEIALSCALLTVSGLLIKGVLELRAVDFGMPVERMVTGEVELPRETYPTPESRVAFFEQLQLRAAAIPGVRAATVMSDIPGTIGFGSPVTLPGAGPAGNASLRVPLLAVSPSFLETLDAAVVEGRGFASQDRAGAEPVALVNRALAAAAFPGQRAVGRAIEVGDVLRTIVGVVPDLFMGTMEEPGANGPGVYIPVAQGGWVSMQLVARTEADPMSVISGMRDAVESLDPNLALMAVDRVDRVIAGETAVFETFGTLFLSFGLVALFLAAVGLHGVIAFAVRQRTREWGVRIALGASASRVLGLASRRAAIEIAVGLAVGLVISGILSVPLSNLFYRVVPWDLTIFAVVTVVLAAVGLVSTLVPARRATQVDPVDALRYR